MLLQFFSSVSCHHFSRLSSEPVLFPCSMSRISGIPIVARFSDDYLGDNLTNVAPTRVNALKTGKILYLAAHLILNEIF